MCPARDEARPHVICGPNARKKRSARTCSADDQGKEKPALLFFRHASIGTNSLNTILALIAAAFTRGAAPFSRVTQELVRAADDFAEVCARLFAGDLRESVVLSCASSC
jgi:hypothetical protein